MRFLRRTPAHGKHGPAFDADETAWLLANRRPFSDHVVGSLVPVVFERYARLFHPAWAQPRRPWAEPPRAVRWDTAARWSGRRMHALAQWVPIADPADERPSGACPFDAPPETGGLPPDQLGLLCGHLAAATTTPERCYHGLWEGYWGPSDAPGDSLSLELDERSFLVRQGPLRLAVEMIPRNALGGPMGRPPALIWPADRAWFVATDPDLDSTYVGGSEAAIAAILGDERLEARPIEAADDVTAASDEINRPAGR